MSVQYTHAAPRGFYTREGRALWEIEVAHSLRELHVIAHEAAPLRIRDMYCGELEMAEQCAVLLSPVEARRLAIALLAAAEEYERFLSPVSVTP